MITPNKLGVPKYEGTPNEAAKIVKRAAKSFGTFRGGHYGFRSETRVHNRGEHAFTANYNETLKE